MPKLRVKEGHQPPSEMDVVTDNSNQIWMEQRLSEATDFLLSADAFAPYLQRCVGRLARSGSDLSVEESRQLVATCIVQKLRDLTHTYDAEYFTTLATNATSHKPSMANLANTCLDLVTKLHELSVHEWAMLNNYLGNGESSRERWNLDAMSNTIPELRAAALKALTLPVKRGPRLNAHIHYFVSRIFSRCGAISSKPWARSNRFVEDNSAKGFVNPNAQLAYMILRTFIKNVNISSVRTSLNSLAKKDQ